MKTLRRLADIPTKDRCGVVPCTPSRYIEAVAQRSALSASDELVDAEIDAELADLKMLILARREAHLAQEESWGNKPGNQSE